MIRHPLAIGANMTEALTGSLHRLIGWTAIMVCQKYRSQYQADTIPYTLVLQVNVSIF